jgi:aminoglycoside phosphotransferase (APT) family kinase protein
VVDQAVLGDVVARAEELLGEQLAGVDTLPGGHSGVTLDGVVVSTGKRIVIKAAPAGRPAKGRHDVLRQARGISYAAAAIPVPQIFVTSDDEPQFCVMSFEAGEAVEPAFDDAPSGDDAALVERRFAVATDLLVKLHALDPSGLLDVDETPTTPAQELAKWERTLRVVDPSFIPLGERAYNDLAAAAPPLWRAAVLHGDYRLGNMLFVDDRVSAVIDWEIWSVGDPRLDLGWFLTYCDPDDFPVIGKQGRVIPNADTVLAQYEAAIGEHVPDVPWFLGFGAFKMGTVMAHNLERHRSGRHHDPFQESLPPTIEHLLTRATSLAGAGVKKGTA